MIDVIELIRDRARMPGCASWSEFLLLTLTAWSYVRPIMEAPKVQGKLNFDLPRNRRTV